MNYLTLVEEILEENSDLKTLCQSICHLVRPLLDLETTPNRLHRMKYRKLIQGLEEEASNYETSEKLATFLTSTLGDPSSPQSIQIPPKSGTDLQTTLLLCMKERTSPAPQSQSSQQSMTTTFTASMGAMQPGGVGVSTAFPNMQGGNLPILPFNLPLPTEKICGTIWYRDQASGASYSGEIDLAGANYCMEHHLKKWDPVERIWKTIFIHSDALDQSGILMSFNAFQVAQNKATNWKTKAPFNPEARSGRQFRGSRNNFKQNGAQRYNPY